MDKSNQTLGEVLGKSQVFRVGEGETSVGLPSLSNVVWCVLGLRVGREAVIILYT